MMTAFFEFPTVKLLDYEAKWQELEQSRNPFAMVVMAHLKAIATHGKAGDRLHWKKLLVKMLYERGYAEQEVIDLFRFIDWILKLPEGLDKEIQAVVDSYEETKQMRYVTSIERLAAKQARLDGELEGEERGKKKGEKKGRSQAQRETILQILQFRFQLDTTQSTLIATQLYLLEEEATLKLLINNALEVKDIADFQLLLPSIQPNPDQVPTQP